MNISNSNFSELTSAVQTRDTLKSIEQRHSNAYRTSDDLVGPRLIPNLSGKLIPAVSADGSFFASASMLPHYGLSLPNDTKVGSIVEYTDKHLAKWYGVVEKISSGDRSIVVQSVDRSTAKAHQNANPGIPIYSVDDAFVSVQSSTSLIQSMSLLGWSEYVVFKILSLILMQDIDFSKGLIDVFAKIYGRILIFITLVSLGIYLLINVLS